MIMIITEMACQGILMNNIINKDHDYDQHNFLRYGEVWLASWRGEKVAVKTFFTTEEVTGIINNIIIIAIIIVIIIL